MSDALSSTLGEVLSAEARALLNAVGIVVLVISPDHRILGWNHEAELLYGCPEEEALGKNYVETFLAEEARAEVAADMRKVLAGESVQSSANPVVARDGTVRYVQWHARPLRDAEGRSVAVVASGYEVTEFKRDRDKLERSQTEMQEIIDNAPVVLFVKDLEGRFTTTNRTFDENLGHTKGFAVGKMDADILPPEVAASNLANDQAVLAADAPVEFEERIPSKNGLRIFWAVKFPLRDEQGNPYAVCGIASDVTALREAEEERATFQAQIIEAQRMALRELSTPLLPIAPGVVLLPLVGAIDSARAALVLEALLEGVVAHQAEVAILDITGIRAVDDEVANGIVQAARATALLGAQVVLTGVRPAAARTLVELGVDMSGIVALSSLQQGVAHAIRRSRRG
ncbi:PAS domain-containing protein [Polyangium aurulentum]|uniref:PAS domain-containing protein n=1 Tax=Polyangium aurulentum TaxID=2567896 RepID=UPI0010AE8117|nr:PAS domain-containing protein [Polyangium aurulentum]UQA59161.1 PAS domain-containing protein [Polyangium aurulentum]